MNSVNKIGVMALTKIFAKKPYVFLGKAHFSEVIFSNQEIDFDLIPQIALGESYQIWSIELGLISVQLRTDKNLYYSVLRTLKKLQKEDVPSHLIISQTVKGEARSVTTITVYRLTEERALTMYYQDLTPSIDKRAKALQMKAETSHAQYLAWCKEFDESIKD